MEGDLRAWAEMVAAFKTSIILASHCHRLTETSVITMLHGRLDLPDLQDVYAEVPEVPPVSIISLSHQLPEPFAITMIEAMACGTPVIATSYGAFPEVVVEGRTGFICRSMGEMLASVQKIDRLDRRACRVHVAERFSVKRTADGYEAAYRRVLEAPVTAAYRSVDAPAPVAMLSASAG